MGGYSKSCFQLTSLGYILVLLINVTGAMLDIERIRLKEEAREMFYHAYRSYMDNAYPADELMPLSCKGRYRNTEPGRGDIDDALGNFSLTLVDSLDTLLVLGDLDEFEHAVKLVIRDVTFDRDVVVSVFETNIRMLGGLLSGHILASYAQDRLDRMPWYRAELLTLAKDLGYRLLPAFNTTTGVPHPRINLQSGVNSPQFGSARETCTACAGTMILEFAALSRLTGEAIFEEKARKAMDYLWALRHRASDLMGTVLNIHNGDWVRRDSGVGAGIDSYYEYCLKAYILLGDEVYLDRFNKHYAAVMKYISQGPLLVDVHMHRPHTNARNFMDSLLAFWPGLQVLKGDIKPAIETHEMLYQVLLRHNFLPEAFTTDFQVHWGQYPLRPEFVESTYFLFKATGDPYYLEVGRNVMESLQKYTKVPCGYAAVKDVRTGSHEDRMDSFVLAETFKYLYLLFAQKEDLLIEIDDFLFTTEAHLLPLSLARMSPNSSTFVMSRFHLASGGQIPSGAASSTYKSLFFESGGLPEAASSETEDDYERSCPNTNYLFPGDKDFAQVIRQPLKNLVEGVCPRQPQGVGKDVPPKQRQLRVAEFQAGNEEHAKRLKKIGITVMTLADGRVQLLHSSSTAESTTDAEEGLLFMQEMIDLANQQSGQTVIQQPRVVHYRIPETGELRVVSAGPAQFGVDLAGGKKVSGETVLVEPSKCCHTPDNFDELKGKIGIIYRGDCMFIEKAKNLEEVGAIAGIVIDNSPGTTSMAAAMFAMSGDGKTEVNIPLVFLFTKDAQELLLIRRVHPNLLVTLSDSYSANESDDNVCDKVGDECNSFVESYGQQEAIPVTASREIQYSPSKNDLFFIQGKQEGVGTAEPVPSDQEEIVSTIEKVVTITPDTNRQQPNPPVDSAKIDYASSKVQSVHTRRHREYLLTLKKLIETTMSENKELDPQTKEMLVQLSVLLRPKTELQRESPLKQQKDVIDKLLLQLPLNVNDYLDALVKAEEVVVEEGDSSSSNDEVNSSESDNIDFIENNLTSSVEL